MSKQVIYSEAKREAIAAKKREIATAEWALAEAPDCADHNALIDNLDTLRAELAALRAS